MSSLSRQGHAALSRGLLSAMSRAKVPAGPCPSRAFNTARASRASETAAPILADAVPIPIASSAPTSVTPFPSATPLTRPPVSAVPVPAAASTMGQILLTGNSPACSSSGPRKVQKSKSGARGTAVLEDVLMSRREDLVSRLFSKVPKGFGAFYPKKSGGEAEGKDKDSSADTKTASEKADDDKEGSGNSKDPNDPKPDPTTAALQIAALTYFLYYVLKQEGTPEITFQELVNDFLRFGYIERLQVVNKETCRVLLRNDVTLPQNLVKRVGESREFLVQLGSPESFESKVEAYQHSLGIHPQDFIPIQYVTERDYWDDALRALPSLLILLPALFLAYSYTRGMGGGSGGAGRTGSGGFGG
eukprot:CAMPEP_0178992804 /NCGR_PEP_ID=MMETSP0795-20121207/6324_1 /TAXON_ID=88552 /ORGANISM="Amoebophrya sp., Strain Ameob2" /LENGTH=359 /DNA_ID=CAMNT_0020684739 /DNA_START=261 /DNA_END=1336 /DNA_ORIENTATION=-